MALKRPIPKAGHDRYERVLNFLLYHSNRGVSVDEMLLAVDAQRDEWFRLGLTVTLKGWMEDGKVIFDGKLYHAVWGSGAVT